MLAAINNIKTNNMRTDYELSVGLLKAQWEDEKIRQAVKQRSKGNEEKALQWEQCHMLDDIDKEGAVIAPQELLALLQTPQGIEFAVQTKLPSTYTLEQLVGNHPEQGIIVKPGTYTMHNHQTANGRNVTIAVGRDVLVKATFTEPLHPSPVIVALHGATVRIEASGFAVCRAIRDAQSFIYTTKKDKAIILQ